MTKTTIGKYGICLFLAAAVAFMPRITARADVQGAASWKNVEGNHADLYVKLVDKDGDHITAVQIETILSAENAADIQDVSFEFDKRWEAKPNVASYSYNEDTERLTVIVANDGKSGLATLSESDSELPVGTLTVSSKGGVRAVINSAKTVSDGELEEVVSIHGIETSLAGTESGRDDDEQKPDDSGSGSGSESSSGGGNSSGGSSSGGGGSSGGSRNAGLKIPGTDVSRLDLPSYVVSNGTWSRDALGRWFYTAGRAYVNEWAAIYNPYADAAKGQQVYDWFRFGPDGAMVTGWFTDSAGDTYYLSPDADGTMGHMLTGWNWIDGDGDGSAECYYFEPVSNGYRGRMYRSTTTPDGYTVNAAGQWFQNGAVVKRSGR